MSTIKADNISPVGSTLNLTAPIAGLSVAGGLTVGGIAFFSGGVTFNSTTNFTGLVTLTGGATSAAVISCGTAPTQGQHLANKTYVDSLQPTGTRNILGCVMPLFAEGNADATTAAIPEGTWFVFLLGDTFTNAVGCFAHAKVWTVPTGQYLRFMPTTRTTGTTDTTSSTKYQISTTSTTNSTTGTWTDLPAQLENVVDNLSAGTHVGSVMRTSSESSRRIFGYCYRIG